MGERTDSDEVDLFVGDADPDPDSLLETSRFIAAYKQKPGYQAKVEEGKKILADLGIDSQSHGMPNAKSMLDHWHQCIADLAGNRDQCSDAENANGTVGSAE
jgi:hypothetical protein